MSLRTMTYVQIASLLVLALAVAFLAVAAFSANKALCSFKADLDQRTQRLEDLLEDDPGDPIHAYGLSIPRSQLESQLANQQAALNSLSIPYC